MDYVLVGSIKNNGLSGTHIVGLALLDSIVVNSKQLNGSGQVNGDYGYMPAVGILSDPDVLDAMLWNESTFAGKF